MSEQLYKMLTKDRRSPGMSGAERYLWPIGEWTPEVADPKCCERGWHLVTQRQLLDHLADAECIWLAEGAGEWDEQADKSAWSTARITEQTAWDERSARLFAVDCAEHVRHFIRKDWQETMDVVYHTIRAYAYGGATDDERKAAGYAAHAARVAAWTIRIVAGDAARAARDAAWDTARIAARDVAEAARDAAWDAARVAARDAEREWQVERLGYYLRGEEPPEVFDG